MASVFILTGFLLGLLGMKAFALIVAILIAFFSVLTILYFIAAFSNLMRSTVAFIVICIILAVFFLTLTLVLKNRKYFPATIAITGGIIGYHYGCLFYVLVYKVITWGSLTGMLCIMFFFMFFMAFFAFRTRKSRPALMWWIGNLGGFSFTRGLSLFIGGYPIDPV